MQSLVRKAGHLHQSPISVNDPMPAHSFHRLTKGSAMRKILLAAALCLTILSTGLPSYAEPGRVARWLMGEPMSLFDWGLYKADKKTAELKSMKEKFSSDFFYGAADYDWGMNRIRLRVNFIGKGTEAECIENIKRAKGAFLDFTWNEKEQVKVARDVFTTLFSHEGGYKSKSHPSDIGEQLASMSVMEATVYIPGDKGSYLPRAKCSMDFRSAEVSVVKQ